MGQPRAVVVALVVDEDLGLVLQPAERRAVDDAVPVALVMRAVVLEALGMEPAARQVVHGGVPAERFGHAGQLHRQRTGAGV